MDKLQEFFKQQGLPSNLIDVTEDKSKFITASKAHELEKSGNLHEDIDGKVIIKTGATKVFKFANDEIYISLINDGNVKNNEYGYTNLQNKTYIGRIPTDDGRYAVSDSIHFISPDSIKEMAKSINPSEFKRKRMEELKRRKGENDMPGRLDVKNDNKKEETKGATQSLDTLLADAAQKAGEENKGGINTNVATGNAFKGGEVKTEAEKDAEKAEKERKKAEQLAKKKQENEQLAKLEKERSKNNANILAALHPVGRTALDTQVITFLKENMIISGYFAKTEACTKISIRREVKKDAKDNFIFNYNHADAKSTDPELRSKFEVSKKAYEAGGDNLKQVSAKYKEKVLTIVPTQSAPSGVAGVILRYPKALSLTADKEEINETVSGLLTKPAYEIETVRNVLNLDTFKSVLLRFEFVTTLEKTNAMQEDAAIFGVPGKVAVKYKTVKSKVTGSTITAGNLKPVLVRMEGKANDWFKQGAYIPMYVYGQADLNQPLSAKLSENLNKTAFGNIFSAGWELKDGEKEDKFVVFDKETKDVKAKYFVESLTERKEIEAKPYYANGKNDPLVKMSRIPFKDVKMVKGEDGELKPSTSKNNRAYIKIAINKLDEVAQQPGVVYNNPLVDAEFATAVTNFGSIVDSTNLDEIITRLDTKASKTRTNRTKLSANDLSYATLQALGSGVVDSINTVDGTLLDLTQAYKGVGDLETLTPFN